MICSLSQKGVMLKVIRSVPSLEDCGAVRLWRGFDLKAYICIWEEQYLTAPVRMVENSGYVVFIRGRYEPEWTRGGRFETVEQAQQVALQTMREKGWYIL